MVKLLVGTLLALTAANSVAGNMYVYESNTGQKLLTSISNPSGNSGKYTKKVKTTYYKAPRNTNTIAVKSTNASYIQSVSEFEVPEGYRLPTKADVTHDWERFNAPNHLKADFNGDGIEDEAYILPKKGSKLGYGVFVSINKAKSGIQSGRKSQMFKLTSDDEIKPQSFAIKLAKPSNEVWETACGKGYWECKIGEPAEFKIDNPSIMFCYIESGCNLYLWDKSNLAFKEVQFSD